MKAASPSCSPNNRTAFLALLLPLALAFFAGFPAVASLAEAPHSSPPWTPRAEKLLQLRPDATAREILDAFVGVPYRSDGAVDKKGRFVLFADPATRFDTPGLNCSGFVVAALRLLLQNPVSLEQAKLDRLNDSGENAPLGQDWDFGWDVALNLLEGRPTELLLPQGALPLDAAALQGLDGRSLRGFELTSVEAWRQVLPLMQAGTIVLADWSKPWNKQGYTLLHHHMALILPLKNGERWYYHAVGKRGVERLALHTRKGLARLLKMYPPSSLGARRALLLSTPLPGK